MHPVVGQLKRQLAVLSALFITFVTRGVKGHQTCGPNEFQQCAKPLSVLTDSGLTWVSSKADLDRICPEWHDAIRCIHNYARNCMSYNHRRHFKKLFHGTGKMVQELCRSGSYQDEFLKYAPCMNQVRNDTKVCFTKYTQAMEEIQNQTTTIEESEPDYYSYQKKKREAAYEGIRGVCCSFREYTECSTNTMRNTCGDEAADFSRRFLDQMSSEMIKLHCAEYDVQKCGLGTSSSSSGSTSQLFASLLAVLVSLSHFLR